MGAPGRRDGASKIDKAKGISAAATELSLRPDLEHDQSAALQAAIDRAALAGVRLVLPAGRFRVSGVQLRAGSDIVGAGDRTILELSGRGAVLTGHGAHGIRLSRFAVDGRMTVDAATRASGRDGGLIEIHSSRDIAIDDIAVGDGVGDGLVLIGVSGRVTSSRLERLAFAGLRSLDAAGLEISHNQVRACGNNGILVWRSQPGEDGTIVSDNRIAEIAALAGGSGQNGNGINVFRAGNVLVRGNRIVDCAYSAIRANAASNVQMVANTMSRIGEVALYAEFGFEGALIASNLIDGAASGISVSNFNEGGRLAVIQGNLVRNLKRREHEPVDKRGEGISVEADAAVTGNTIEGAPTAGLVIGWGPYMRNVVATSNVIRKARVGIVITRDPAAGACLVAQNLISGATDGAIRLMENGKLVGDDLVRGAWPAARLAVSGNVATDRES